MRRLRLAMALARLEGLHIRRDRTTRSLILVVPALQLLLFGVTVSLDPRDVTLAIAGGEPALVAAVEGLAAETGRFVLTRSNLEPGAAERLVIAGDVQVAIELPPPLLGQDDEAKLPRLIADASDPGAVRVPVALLERALLRRAAAQGRLAGPPEVAIEWRYNATARVDWAVIPGLTGVVVMISMMMLGALTLVREREQGTWEGLLAAPLRPLDALLGKLAPYLAIALLQSLVVIGLARLFFDLPVRGSLASALLVAGLGALAHLAIGFAISARTRTQMQAIQLAVFLYLPSMLLSGFLFPRQAMPRWAEIASEALPLTHVVEALRQILLRGPDAVIAPSLAALAALTAIAVTIAVAAYRPRLD